ncbi:hypothetical protein EDB84DRAFT_926558 [Lactarius hengduanensis]|nr:hypothetical protein EDB84DRAFT_926558 [Lactarius hengduanensis]
MSHSHVPATESLDVEAEVVLLISLPVEGERLRKHGNRYDDSLFRYRRGSESSAEHGVCRHAGQTCWADMLGRHAGHRASLRCVVSYCVNGICQQHARSCGIPGGRATCVRQTVVFNWRHCDAVTSGCPEELLYDYSSRFEGQHTAIDEFAIERLGRRLKSSKGARIKARIVSSFELAKESDPPRLARRVHFLSFTSLLGSFVIAHCSTQSSGYVLYSVQ